MSGLIIVLTCGLGADRVTATALDQIHWIRARHADGIMTTDQSCAGASSTVALSSLGVRLTVSQVVSDMDDERSTSVDHMIEVFNSLQPRGWNLRLVRVPDVADLISYLSYDLSRGVALPETVTTDHIPYADPSSVPVVHELVVDGIDVRSGQVSVFETAPGAVHGDHVVLAAELFEILDRPSGPVMAVDQQL